MGNQVLYPHMQNYAYGDRRTHMGIPVCIQAGIAKIFAYGDPRSHNEIVRILGATSGNRKDLKCVVCRRLWSVVCGLCQLIPHVQYISFSFYITLHKTFTQYMTSCTIVCYL